MNRMSRGKDKTSFRMPDEQFEVFKQKLVPVLYDFFANYHLKYSTQTCRCDLWAASCSARPWFAAHTLLSSIAAEPPQFCFVIVKGPGSHWHACAGFARVAFARGLQWRPRPVRSAPSTATGKA